MKIEELIYSIKNNDIVIPEFQREFVWGNDRVKSLINSLMLEYPVGGILIWKTNNPPRLKGKTFSQAIENKNYQVLLDGQQRSTALYMMITGEIPPYYEEKDIVKDPRSLAFNLYTKELQYWRQSMENDETWVYVTDCMKGNISDVKIATSIYKKYVSLGDLKNFNFDFDIKRTQKAFSVIRDLFEQAGLNLHFSSQQNWKISLPTKTINTTISELDSLYKGARTTKHWAEYSEEDYEVDQDKFYKFWIKKISELEEVIAEFTDLEKIVQTFNRNYISLTNIKKLDIFSQEIPSRSSFAEAIDIFDRINSKGLQLSKSDLALTHITAIWPDARREMKKTLDYLKSRDFELNLNITTRILVAYCTGRGSFENISKSGFSAIRTLTQKDLIDGWKNSEKILNYLIEILISEKITNSSLIKSKAVIIPVFYFLSLNKGEFLKDQDRKDAIYWFHNALIWGRYAGQTDQRLEEDLNAVKQKDTWSSLLSKIKDQRGRIKIESKDLEGEGSDSRYYNSYCIMLSHNNARDWFNGIKINSSKENSFSLHKHHIFPRSLLTNHDSDMVNEIANLAIITDTTNIKISNKDPYEYLPEIQNKYPDVLDTHLIPNNKELWRIDRFNEFLSERRMLIANALNAFLNSYKDEDKEIDKVDDTQELILLPESENLEYKETWHFDINRSRIEEKPFKNDQMQLNCIKTVAAFLNSNGGNLFIGVADDNTVEGLDRDLSFFNNSIDKIEQNISEILLNSLGSEKKPYYKIYIVKIQDKYVARIETKRCMTSKTWTKFKGEETFYIRDGNSTRPLSPEDADNYWHERENV